MKRSLAITILLLSTAVICAAKDKSYQWGTLEYVIGPTGGWVDTTTCYRAPDGLHCGGGIKDEIGSVYLLTTADGQRVSLTHAPWRHDVLKQFNASKSVLEGQDDKHAIHTTWRVQYRVDHPHMGQTFIYLVDPSGKEGVYYTTDKFDWKAAQ